MNADTTLYRLIHRHAAETGRDEIGSNAFKPGPISMYNGAMLTAGEAVAHYRKTGNQAVAIIGIKVSDLERLGMIVEYDGLEHPYHVTVSYPDGIGPSRRNKLARLIRDSVIWYEKV